MPLAVFRHDLHEVSAEAEGVLAWLPQNLLKFEISNALHSFQDSAYRWEQIDQSLVVKLSDLSSNRAYRSSSETALLATVPYAVAVDWRHGSEYIHRAEQLLNR